MIRSLFLYGLSLAAAAFILTWIDYRFWARDIGFEVYGLILAALGAGFGVWIERQRRPASTAPPDIPNHKAIKALGLTRRELNMLEFLKSGKSNKEIARDLGISPNTVKTHLTNLYEKLGVTNRTQAVTKAVELSIHSS